MRRIVIASALSLDPWISDVRASSLYEIDLSSHQCPVRVFAI